MFHAATIAVFAVALSASAFAQQLGNTTIYPVTNAGIEDTQVMSVTAASTASLVISSEAILPAVPASGFVALATGVTPEAISTDSRDAPRWATMLAIAGPLADGLSTVYALRQTGPHAQVKEGNSFYTKLFGANVKSHEIMALKVVQAAFMGYGVHAGARKNMERAIGSAILQSAVNLFVASRNMKSAAAARRLNAAGSR